MAEMHYGKVTFKRGGLEGAMLQRKLTEELIMADIIQVSRLNVEKWFEEDKNNPSGCTHNIVLHNKREEEAFRKIMQDEEFASSPYIEWEVCRLMEDYDFRKWTEEVMKDIRNEEEKATDTAFMEGHWLNTRQKHASL